MTEHDERRAGEICYSARTRVLSTVSSLLLGRLVGRKENPRTTRRYIAKRLAIQLRSLSTDPRTGVVPGMPETAMCVRDVDVQCVLQFTLIHAAGCALHRRTSRVIHRLELSTFGRHAAV